MRVSPKSAQHNRAAVVEKYPTALLHGRTFFRVVDGDLDDNVMGASAGSAPCSAQFTISGGYSCSA